MLEHSEGIDGVGMIVEIDESKFGKGKIFLKNFIVS